MASMRPYISLQAVNAELEGLGRNLVACSGSAAQTTASLDSITENVTALRAEINELGRDKSLELVKSVGKQGRRIQTLLEAVVAFHSKSIFSQSETRDNIYSSDGTLDTRQDPRIVFEG